MKPEWGYGARYAPPRVWPVRPLEFRVTYELIYNRNSKAARERLMQALLSTDTKLHSSYCGGARVDPQASFVVLVSVQWGKVELFHNLARPDESRYRSPTWFDNGSIRPLFDSPEEQVEHEVSSFELWEVAPSPDVIMVQE